MSRKSSIPKPFLKWAGGKNQLLPELTKRIPKYDGKYFEPFLGGGAFYFHLKPAESIIADLNEELIHCYKTVRDDTDALIQQLKTLKYSKEDYYDMRSRDPNKMDHINRAARTIYLNRTGFNGLYRVNKSGKFNVPIGRYSNPLICDEKNLRACADLLRTSCIESVSFEDAVRKAKAGDFVYFDPPYIPISETSYFTSYQSGRFSIADQEKLFNVFKELTKKEVFSMLSNSSVPWIHKTYKEFKIDLVSANRMINSKAAARVAVEEVIVTNYDENSNFIR